MPTTPARILDGNFRLPDSNVGTDAFYRDREFMGQEADRAELARQRQQELDTQAAIRKSLETSQAAPEPAAPIAANIGRGKLGGITSAPLEPARHPDVVGVTDGYETDVIPPSAPPVMPRSPAGGRLGAVSSAPQASPQPPNSGPSMATSPSMGGGAPSNPRTTPASPMNTRGSALDRVSSLDESLVKNLTAVNPREALAVKTGSMQRDIKEIERQNDMELKVLKLAAGGDIDGAQAMAAQNGLDIDPRVLSNGEMLEAGIITAETAKANNADHDDAWMERFMGNFMETRDAQQALRTAGRPKPKPKPEPKPGTYKSQAIEGPDGKRTWGRFNTTDGTLEDTGLGAPAAAGGIGGSRPGDVVMMDFLVEKKIVPDYNAAAEWVKTSKSNPKAQDNMILNAATRLAANEDFARTHKGAEGGPLQEAMRQLRTAASSLENPAGGGNQAQFFDLPQEDGTTRQVYTVDGEKYFYSDTNEVYDGPFEGEDDTDDADNE